MDDIDDILNDFDAIYAKADVEAAARFDSRQDGDEDEELDVMAFMASPSRHQPISMESNDNLDDQINSFMRKNSKTENKARPQSADSKKNKKVKMAAISAPADSEEELLEEEPLQEDYSHEDYSEAAADEAAAMDAEDEQPEVDEDTSPAAQRKERPYQTDMMRPVVQYGNTKLSYGEAKLYGLLDENGEVRITRDNESFKRSREAVLHSRAMAERKEPPKRGPTDEEKEMTFKPQRSKEAQKAMSARGCGYDFVSKLGEGGDFLQRTFAKGEKVKTEKRLLESQKEDYEARLDRLKCPSCHKFQAFDEFIERKRSCQQCNVRYVKSSVSHPKAYAKKQEEAEQRKRERLKKIEDELYPPLPKHSGKAGGKTLVERTSELIAAQQEQARADQEAKKRAQIEALARARAPPKAVTQPIQVALAESKPQRPPVGKGHGATLVPRHNTGGSAKAAVKHSVISEKFNKLIQYPTEEVAEAK